VYSSILCFVESPLFKRAMIHPVELAERIRFPIL